MSYFDDFPLRFVKDFLCDTYETFKIILIVIFLWWLPYFEKLIRRSEEKPSSTPSSSSWKYVRDSPTIWALRVSKIFGITYHFK